VQRVSEASSVGTLADGVVRCVRDFTGYDRVMVYKFDPDGHGKIIAEARDPRLDSLLGHHYPATDIPQRARELYLRNRVRVLADVHYEAQALVPPLRPDSGLPLDMSMCHLRSMSPLHLQYLKNMGVLPRGGAGARRKVWGLRVATTPARTSFAARCADLLAEVNLHPDCRDENYAMRRWPSRCVGSSNAWSKPPRPRATGAWPCSAIRARCCSRWRPPARPCSRTANC
jgi:hypothetical protein